MKVLNERQSTHGDFSCVASVAQELKKTIAEFAPAEMLPQHREALDLICTKVARIVCGDPCEEDHWVDIAGYAELGRRAIFDLEEAITEEIVRKDLK